MGLTFVDALRQTIFKVQKKEMMVCKNCGSNVFTDVTSTVLAGNKQCLNCKCVLELPLSKNYLGLDKEFFQSSKPLVYKIYCTTWSICDVDGCESVIFYKGKEDNKRKWFCFKCGKEIPRLETRDRKRLEYTKRPAEESCVPFFLAPANLTIYEKMNQLVEDFAK